MSQEYEQQKIMQVDLEREMKKSYIDYAMSVIVGRALPDVRDGLKPVHRRILYAMYEDGLTSDKPYRKSATTVGNVLGRYHPHGDASVYDAMVRMAQPFSLHYPLIDGHGNFGSVDGDPPAAYRYTEARMSKISTEMLTDIDKDTVNFISNYDDSRKEPEVLPSRFPNLLVNGSTGIAVGMATNIPPHNLGETIDAVCYLIDNPDAGLEDLMEYIKGPDFPTGAMIMGRAGIRAAYATGRGKITVRAVAEIVEEKNGRFKIIVTELPYQVNKARLIESIADMVKDKRIEGISNIDDHSDRNGMHIEIDLKRDASPQIVLNQLYSYTQMQTTFGVIMLAKRRAEDPDPERNASGIHQVSGGGHHPPDHLRPEEGPGARPYFRGLEDRAGQYRRDYFHYPQFQGPSHRQVQNDGTVRPGRRADRGHCADAPGTAHRPGTAENRRRIGGAGIEDQGL